MSPNIPEKQWAQVIEKTGGPVEYKQIPGQYRGFQGTVDMLIAPQSRNRVRMRSSSTSNIQESAIPIYMPSTVTGPLQPSCRSSVATRVLVSS